MKWNCYPGNEFCAYQTRKGAVGTCSILGSETGSLWMLGTLRFNTQLCLGKIFSLVSLYWEKIVKRNGNRFVNDVRVTVSFFLGTFVPISLLKGHWKYGIILNTFVKLFKAYSTLVVNGTKRKKNVYNREECPWGEATDAEIVHSSHSMKVLEKTYIKIVHSFFNSTKILEMLGLLHTLYKCPYVKSKYLFTWE